MESGTPFLLEGRHLNKTYRSRGRQVRPLQDVSFTLSQGEFLGIVGESGSGKSTLLRVVSCLEKPDAGQLFLHGKEYTGSRPSYTGQHMQMIFQDAEGSFDPTQRLLRSIREAGKRGDEEIKRLMREVGLEETLLSRRPRELSGGQCQRMSITRALYSGARILLCDEITSALDVTTQAQVAGLLRQLRESEHLSILFVSHDLALVSQLCDRVMVMKEGECVEEGATMQVICDPQHPYTKELLAAAQSL